MMTYSVKMNNMTYEKYESFISFYQRLFGIEAWKQIPKWKSRLYERFVKSKTLQLIYDVVTGKQLMVGLGFSLEIILLYIIFTVWASLIIRN